MPTFVHGKNSKFAISAIGTQTTLIDLSTALKEVNFPRNIDMAETSALGSTFKSYIQGLADATISASGQWATGSAEDIDDLLSDLVGAATETNFAYAPAGWSAVSGTAPTYTDVTASATQPIIHGHVWLSSYEVSGSIGDVLAVSCEFQLASDPTTIRTGTYAPT